MAGQIYGFNQVFDANGDPLDGAKLLTRVPGTTTPKATYTDATLAVALPNPIIADSAGRFPQIFAADGEIFDLVLTTALDVTVESYYDVVALGTTTGGILLDFGADGRFAVDGSGGMPNIEFGDPVGDDVGGDGRIGGWDGTQGTNLEIDFATVEITGNLVVDGTINGSGGLPSVPAVVSRGTATASSQTDIAIPSTYSTYMLELRNYIGSPATAQTLNGVLSFDNGATYKTGATDYQTTQMLYAGGGAVGVAAAANQPTLWITRGTGGANNGALGGTDVRVQLWTGASRETRIYSQVVGFTAGDATLSPIGDLGGTTNNKAYGRATNIRITPTSGTMTFDWVLTGIP